MSTGRMSHPTFGHQAPRGRHLHAVPDPSPVRGGGNTEQMHTVGCLPAVGTGLLLLALVLAPWAIVAVLYVWAVR